MRESTARAAHGPVVLEEIPLADLPPCDAEGRIRFSRPINFAQLVGATASIQPESSNSSTPNGGRRLQVIRLPAEVWPMLISWIESLQWSATCKSKTGTARTRAQCSCSWAELALAFRLQTCFTFAHNNLEAAISFLAAAFRRLYALMDCNDNPQLRMRNYGDCYAARMSIGFYINGINRRPDLPHELWRRIDQLLRATKDAGDISRARFGKSLKMPDDRTFRCNDIGDPLELTQAQIQACLLQPQARVAVANRVGGNRPINLSAAARSGPCVFGCGTSSSSANGLTTWRGVPKAFADAVNGSSYDDIKEHEVLGRLTFDSTLCSRHYGQVCQHLRRIMRRSAQEMEPT